MNEIEKVLRLNQSLQRMLVGLLTNRPVYQRPVLPDGRVPPEPNPCGSPPTRVASQRAARQEFAADGRFEGFIAGFGFNCG